MKHPPFLAPGATVALVCPAGFMAREKTKACVHELTSWGYRVLLGSTIGGKSTTYFSGTDKQRLRDLQQFLDDPKVDAVLCARGGYGSTRILDQIDWRGFKQHPKWIIGFSDITILHGYMSRNLGISSIHGPMARAFDPNFGNPSDVRALQAVLEGEATACRGPRHAFNQLGTASAPVVGGNLSLIAHSIGTNACFKTKGKILFLEDVGEQLYNIDRMMLQLKRAGMFKGLKGLILGGFTESKDTERPFGKNSNEILAESVKEFRFPICFNFPISHDKTNFPIAIGQRYTLVVDKNGSRLSSTKKGN